ncbi:MAG TPA: histidine kinase dimerization/phospho-acceptor domain-containing protein [Longimicrobiaceae bacterium]|nr:histidine kinase dimerization/phospho-acceptor domain-containing protein [Longimicrobiaceae bacterium]
MASVQMSGLDPREIRNNKLDLVERLADDLAHEIKNPLHSMVINLEVLRRRIGRAGVHDADELLRFVGVVNAELDRVSRRVEILLRLLRPDRSGEPVTIQEILDEILELLEIERERLGVSLEIRAATEPLRGYVGREPGRQLVLNVVLSALERTPPRGRLVVETEPDAGEARLRVRSVPPEGSPGSAAALDPERLAVFRALAEAVGGRVEDLRSGTVAELVLTLPARAV